MAENSKGVGKRWVENRVAGGKESGANHSEEPATIANGSGSGVAEKGTVRRARGPKIKAAVAAALPPPETVRLSANAIEALRE